MSQKILVADDEPKIAALVASYLEASDFTVIRAFNGIDALKAFNDGAPDCLILDINMPRIDGFELLRRMKANDALVSVPVVMLTTEGQEQDKEQATMLGAAAYLVKPFKPTSLLALVNEVLSR